MKWVARWRALVLALVAVMVCAGERAAAGELPANAEGLKEADYDVVGVSSQVMSSLSLLPPSWDV